MIGAREDGGAGAAAAACGAGAACGPMADAVAALMRELVALLDRLGPEQYTARTGPLFADGTVGGHVRHCLDHARALAAAAAGRAGERCAGVVDYDHRERGTPIETDREAARAEAARLLRAFAALGGRDLDEPVRVAVIADRGGTAVTLRSTLGRELAFVLSHTVHHNAIVRGMVLSLGVAAPATLGYAPSTLAHMDGVSCAR